MNIDCNLHVESYVKDAKRRPYDKRPSPNPLGLDGVYTFMYSYPLSVRVEFTHELMPEMSALDILALARDDYKAIYAAEDSHCGVTENIPGMLNRQSSNGPYGIWGHAINDLYFETIIIKVDQRTVSFDIGS